MSVVIPAFNQAEFLDEAISSVLAQDYPDVELIVLNDGSTDETAAVMEKYRGKAILVSHPNIGQANTLNKGWQMAKGEILSFIAADDALLPAAVRQAVVRLESRPDAVLSYCDFNLIDSSSHIIRRVRSPEMSYDDMVAKVVCPPGPGTFFKRRVYEEIGPWDATLKVMLDYDYWLRVGLRGKLVHIPEALALYRIHDGSQTFAGYDEVKAEEPVFIITRLFATQALPPTLASRKNEAISNANLVAAQLHLRAGRYRQGFASLRNGLALYPANILKLRTARIALNVCFNKFGHRSVWQIRKLLSKLGRA